jgi:hypothetical protein
MTCLHAAAESTYLSDDAHRIVDNAALTQIYYINSTAFVGNLTSD